MYIAYVADTDLHDAPLPYPAQHYKTFKQYSTALELEKGKIYLLAKEFIEYLKACVSPTTNAYSELLELYNDATKYFESRNIKKPYYLPMETLVSEREVYLAEGAQKAKQAYELANWLIGKIQYENINHLTNDFNSYKLVASLGNVMLEDSSASRIISTKQGSLLFFNHDLFENKFRHNSYWEYLKLTEAKQKQPAKQFREAWFADIPDWVDTEKAYQARLGYLQGLPYFLADKQKCTEFMQLNDKTVNLFYQIGIDEPIQLAVATR